VPGQVGQEATPDEFVRVLVDGFREARRILRPDGVLVINLGDSYAGSGRGPTGHNGIGDQERRQGFVNAPRQGKVLGNRSVSGSQGATSNIAVPGCKPKDLMEIPSRVALALQADGWYLRSRIPWLKRTAMPESVEDRPTSAVEYLFLLSKGPRYFWDGEAIKQPNTAGTIGRVRSGPIQAIGANGTKAAIARGDAGGPYIEASGRAFRNSDPFFATWQGLWCDEDGDPLALIVNPQPFSGSHFATFPPRLVEPFIKAGTSERGCCPSCRAPWRRVVERSGEARQKFYSGAGQHGSDNRRMMRNGQFHAAALTTGWQSGCSCDAVDPIPQTVLDPFAGAGTTLLVADRLGRSAIGIELNPEYARLAEARIEADAGPLLGESVTVEAPRQVSLFGEEVVG
jgi:DNA modification methylase